MEEEEKKIAGGKVGYGDGEKIDEEIIEEEEEEM